MTKLLTVKEVAERLAIAPATIRKWIFTCRLPTVRLGRAVRFREEDIEALIRMGHPLVRSDKADGKANHALGELRAGKRVVG